MKPLAQSRTFWVAILIVVLGAMLSGIVSAPPGTFPLWLTAIAGSLVTALGSVVLILRADDNAKKSAAPQPAPVQLAQQLLQQDLAPAPVQQQLQPVQVLPPPAPPGIAPQARADYRRAGTMGFLSMLLVLVLGALGCASTWPQQCRLDNGTEHCACQQLEGVAHRRSKLATWHCDGQQLPIVVHFGAVHLSAPATEVAP